MKLTSVILAGGQNKRMNGIAKWDLLIQQEKMLDRSIKKLAEVSSNILIVTGGEHRINLSVNHPNISVVYDTTPHLGPLNGILTGLEYCTTDFIFVVAADMPFFSANFAKHMYQIAKNKGVNIVVPSWYGKLQPLHGIYSKSLIDSITVFLQQGKYGLIQWINQQEKKYILSEQETDAFNPDGRIFFNMNYPEDYQQALLWTEEKKMND